MEKGKRITDVTEFRRKRITKAEIRRVMGHFGRLGGKKGGKARTRAKVRAARKNGAKGGRPRKRSADPVPRWAKGKACAQGNHVHCKTKKCPCRCHIAS